LDVNACIELEKLDCGGNKLSASALNALFHALPTVNFRDSPTPDLRNLPEEDRGRIRFCDNPASDACDASLFKSKGWKTRHASLIYI